MKRQLMGLRGAVLAVGLLALGCKGDPTVALVGGVSRVTASISFLTINVGDSAQITAVARDAAGDPTSAATAAASVDATIATASSVTAAPIPATNFFVKGLKAGTTNVILSSGSAVDTLKVVVFPLVFDGAVTLVKTALLDTVVVTSSAVVGFDTLKATVTVDKVGAKVVAISPTQIKALVLNKGAKTGAVVTVKNLVLLGAFPIATLDASTTVDTRGDATEPANNSPATGPVLTLTGTAFTAVDGVFDGSSDVDDYFRVTLANTTTITAEVDFDGKGVDPDIDLYVLNAAGTNFCAFDNGCEAATGSQPQTTTTISLPPGNYVIYVNFFDKGAAAAPFWYKLKVKKNS